MIPNMFQLKDITASKVCFKCHYDIKSKVGVLGLQTIVSTCPCIMFLSVARKEGSKRGTGSIYISFLTSFLF